MNVSWFSYGTRPIQAQTLFNRPYSPLVPRHQFQVAGRSDVVVTLHLSQHLLAHLSHWPVHGDKNVCQIFAELKSRKERVRWIMSRLFLSLQAWTALCTETFQYSFFTKWNNSFVNTQENCFGKFHVWCRLNVRCPVSCNEWHWWCTHRPKQCALSAVWMRVVSGITWFGKLAV